ncbi:MAG: hypothetical protein O9262_08885, partial [Cyclobacteriaceae bacterium]|nr:hypothetical protein [Cyclobacteriaceae bacterium]
KNGCQFNMSRNVSSSFSPLLRLAGAKVIILFYLASFFENNFKILFPPQLYHYINELSLLRGANIIILFSSFQIY